MESFVPGSLKFRASKYTYKTSFSCKVDSKSNDEENEEGGETSELQHSFPFLCFLVLQQRKAKEKTREESKNMSNHARPATHLGHKPPVERAAEVEGGEENEEKQLEETNKFPAKSMRRLFVIKSVDQHHLVLVPVEDCGADARGDKAVDASAWSLQGDGVVGEDVVRQGAGERS